MLEAAGGDVGEGVYEVGGEAGGLSRSEWRGVRSESLPGPWIPAFAGMTVCGVGSFGRLGMNEGVSFGGFGCFDVARVLVISQARFLGSGLRRNDRWCGRDARAPGRCWRTCRSLG